MKCAFHPDAGLEFREAAAFYEARQVGLGAAFTKEIETAIERILAAPERFRFIEQDVRRCLTRTFPYGVLYTVERDLVIIVAVAHGSRKPGYWQERMLDAGPDR
jgi:toxin ParE1/3/4